jgi:putative hemolysin
MQVIISIILIILSLAMQGFFAAAEMAMISSNKIKISHLALRGNKKAIEIERLLKKPEKFLATTLVGVNIAVVLGSSVAAALASDIFTNPDIAAAASVVMMLPVVLIFGQILPMTFARQHSLRFAVESAFPMKTAYLILFPLAFIGGNIANLFSKLFGGRKRKKSYFVTREELKLLIKDEMKLGASDDIIMDMAYEIFDFAETTIDDVMLPLKNVVSCSDKTTVRDVIGAINSSGHSWIPIYNEWRDNIIGVVSAIDLLTEDPDRKTLDVIRPAYLVRETALLDQTITNMRKDKNNFAVVSDPAGKITGIVTLEDIIEEIVGEIEDKYA